MTRTIRAVGAVTAASARSVGYGVGAARKRATHRKAPGGRASGSRRVVVASSRTSAPSASPVLQASKPLAEQALLQELWQISHFGWIPEAAIRRTLTIAGGQELSAVAVAERLRRLQERGWVEQRERDAGSHESEWRLTDSGRSAR